MDKKDLDKLPRKSLLPGFESGRYEPVRQYDHTEFRKPPFEDPVRRDNRISIRISGQDMSRLHRLALAEGLPLQSLVAGIVHRYVNALEGERDAPLPAMLPDVPQQDAAGNNRDLPDFP